MVNEAMARIPDFPKALGLKLSHDALHHGKKEWGSQSRRPPRRCCCISAADSQVFQYLPGRRQDGQRLTWDKRWGTYT